MSGPRPVLALQGRADGLRKVLADMSEDIRGSSSRSPTRLLAMRTMEYRSPGEKQKQKSFETRNLPALVLTNLGVRKVKWELEDLSLEYLDTGLRGSPGTLADEKAASTRRVYGRHPRPDHSAAQANGHQRQGLRPHEAPLLRICRKMYTRNKSWTCSNLFTFRVIVALCPTATMALGVITNAHKR